MQTALGEGEGVVSSSPGHAAEHVTIHAIPGSQYVAKVLLALDAFDVPHRVAFVPVKRSSRRLPGGGVHVPVLECGEEAVADSTAILRWLDDRRGTRCFPAGPLGDAVSAASERISEGFISAAVLYYNWIDPTGHRRSVRAALVKRVPWYLRCCAGFLVDVAVRGTRAELSDQAVQRAARDESVGSVAAARALFAPGNEPEVRAKLVRELSWLQSLLKNPEDPERGYLFGGDEPTAADFSAFALVERLVGTMGDADLQPSSPSLTVEPSLGRLWAWRRCMLDRHPIRFKGKRTTARRVERGEQGGVVLRRR